MCEKPAGALIHRIQLRATSLHCSSLARQRGALLVSTVAQNKALEHVRRNAPGDTVDWRQCVTAESLNAALVAIGDDSRLENQAPNTMRGVKFWNLTDESIEVAAMDYDDSEMQKNRMGAFNSLPGGKVPVRTQSHCRRVDPRCAAHTRCS